MIVSTLSTLTEYAMAPESQKDQPISALAETLQIPYASLVRQTDVLGAGLANAEGLGLIEKR